MSLNKIAKAINNLADSIRYHADNAPSATGRIPKYEGPEVEHAIASLAAQDYAELEKRVNAEELLAGENPEAAVLAADRLNADTPRVNDPQFIAGFDAGLVPAFGSAMPSTDVTVEVAPGNVFASDLKVEIVSEAIDNAEDFVDPYVEPDLSALPAYLDKQRNNAGPDDKPALDVPGWQTLTVEELDVAPPPPVADDDATPEGVTVDANGLPWDARIHSSGKTLLADDTWRLKRGVPDDERQAIEAELKQLMAIPVPPAPAVDKDSQAAEVASAPPPPPPAPSAKITLMPQLIKAITGAELGAMMVTEAVKSVGLENISQLGARPDLVPAVAEALGL